MEELVTPLGSSLGTDERLDEEAQLHIGASDSVGSIVGLADGHANEDCREGEVKTTLNDSLGSEESECAENVAVQVGIRNEASISTEPGDDRVGVAVNGMESALKVHPEMFHAGKLEGLNAAQDADEVTVGTTQVDSPSHVERAALSVGGDVIKPQQCECADGGLIAQSSPSLQGMESVAPGDEVVDRTSLQCGSPSGVTGGTLLHENHSEPSIHDVVEEPKESSRRQRRKMSKKRARARIEKVANEVSSELRPRKTKNMPPMAAASIEPGEDRGVRQFQGSFEEAIALRAAGFDQKAEESDSDDSVASSAGGSSPDWCCNVVTREPLDAVPDPCAFGICGQYPDGSEASVDDATDARPNLNEERALEDDMPREASCADGLGVASKVRGKKKSSDWSTGKTKHYLSSECGDSRTKTSVFQNTCMPCVAPGQQPESTRCCNATCPANEKKQWPPCCLLNRLEEVVDNGDLKMLCCVERS